MRTPTQLPAEFDGRAFTLHEAVDAGIGRDRLFHPQLARPFHGARSTLAPLPDNSRPEQWARRKLDEYRPLLRDGQFFSSVSAAVYWGLPLPRRLYTTDVQVATRWPARAPRVGGTTGHALRRPHVVDRDGWSVQSPADAWCELGAWLSLDELIAAGDAPFYRPRKLASRSRLANAVTNWGRKPGGLLLREAFEWIRENAESPKETEWRLIIVRAGFPEPHLNYPVYDGAELVAILDFAYPQWMTGADYDGRHHAESPAQFARDGIRFNALQRLGWHDIRIMAGMSRESVLDDLEHRLFERGWRRPRG